MLLLLPQPGWCAVGCAGSSATWRWVLLLAVLMPQAVQRHKALLCCININSIGQCNLLQVALGMEHTSATLLRDCNVQYTTDATYRFPSWQVVLLMVCR